jgi:hypothetical protein
MKKELFYLSCFFSLQVSTNATALPGFAQASIPGPPKWGEKYIFCDLPVSPSQEDVRNCIQKIRDVWESAWVPAVRSKQHYLISRQNTASVLKWVGVSGTAAAATLGISNPNSAGTTAIVIGSASVLTAVTGLIWQQDASTARISACTDVLSKQYRIQAMLESWYLESSKEEFRKGFASRVDDRFIKDVIPGLEICMPGEWKFGS